MSAATAKRKDNGRTELDKNPKKMKASPTGKEMIEEKKIEPFATPLSESAGKCVDPGKCNVRPKYAMFFYFLSSELQDTFQF